MKKLLIAALSTGFLMASPSISSAGITLELNIPGVLELGERRKPRTSRRYRRNMNRYHREMHIAYCEHRYRTYDRYTDRYFTFRGRWKRCWSPHKQEIQRTRRRGW